MSQPDTDTTILARNAFFKGELHLAGPALIAGRVEGLIVSEDAIDIGPEGAVEGDIEGTLVDIHGTVKGNVVATQACRLGATARVTGELRAANLAIAEGASFIGQVCVGGTRAVPASQSSHAEIEHAPANRIESIAAEVEELAQTAASAEPAPALAVASGAVPVSVAGSSAPAPTVRVVNQTVQNLQRAPRIIKAR